jgi:hypothetical protein
LTIFGGVASLSEYRGFFVVALQPHFFIGFDMILSARLLTMGLVLALGCLVATGCNQGKQTTIVKGKLVAGGASFSPPLPAMASQLPKPPPGVVGPDQTAQYRPRLTINSSGHSSQAIIAADGTFELKGEQGKGVPPGEYTVSITGAPIPAIDPFAGKLSGQSPFKITVAPGAGATVTLEPFDVGPYLTEAPPPGGAGS